ncbi:MAG: hypothetical protein Q3972_06315 [Corynebacterium sp.]|nr:hypothetical protein [Corynebacterium sp.]
MKNNVKRSLAGAAAFAALGLAAPAVPVLSGSLSAVALPPGGAASQGSGTLTIVNENGSVVAGGLLTIKGTGFEKQTQLALKIDQKDPEQDFEGDDVVKDGAFTYLLDNKLPGEDGNFEFSVRLPANIELGEHEIRVLSPSPRASVATTFTVVEATAEQPAASTPWYKKLFTSSGLSS